MALQPIFDRMAEEAKDICSSGFGTLFRPERGIHGIPEMPDDREAGFIRYMFLQDADALSALFAGRDDAATLVERLGRERDGFVDSCFEDFMDDARVSGKLDGAVQTISSPEDMPDALRDEWDERLQERSGEEGIFLFEVGVRRDHDDEPVLSARLNFECPYYRRHFDVDLFSEKLDKNDMEGSCRRVLAREFPEIAELFEVDGETARP